MKTEPKLPGGRSDACIYCTALVIK